MILGEGRGRVRRTERRTTRKEGRKRGGGVKSIRSVGRDREIDISKKSTVIRN